MSGACVRTQPFQAGVVMAGPRPWGLIYESGQRKRLSRLQTILSLAIQICVDLAAHRLRSILTAIGVIIGIGAVYAIMILGDSGREEARSMLMPYRDGTVLVRPSGSEAQPGIESPRFASPESGPSFIAVDDINYLRAAFAGWAAMSPVAVVHASRVACEGRCVNPNQICAVSADYHQIRKMAIVAGRFLVSTDVDAAVVAVDDGGRFAGLPFPVLDKRLVIGTRVYRIVGLVHDPQGMSAQADVLIPFISGAHNEIERFLIRSNAGHQGRILARAQSLLALRSTMRLSAVSAESDNKATVEALSMVSRLLALIASVSLVVGCIGVMNTLVASVKEKTHEIGVRGALGASPRQIFAHFLAEAFFLCALAGVLGIVCGGIAAKVFCGLNGITAVFRVAPALISFSAALLVGCTGGLVPASQAARLNPWQALHQGGS